MVFSITRMNKTARILFSESRSMFFIFQVATIPLFGIFKSQIEFITYSCSMKLKLKLFFSRVPRFRTKSLLLIYSWWWQRISMLMMACRANIPSRNQIGGLTNDNFSMVFLFLLQFQKVFGFPCDYLLIGTGRRSTTWSTHIGSNNICSQLSASTVDAVSWNLIIVCQ